MKPNQLHESIAMQIDNMKPDHLFPGVDIGMAVVDDTALGMVIHPTDTRVVIRYNEGADDYRVTICQGDKIETHDGLFCDQLGPIIFGEDSKEFSLPFFKITDENGNVISEG